MSRLRKRYGTSTVGVVVLLSAAELRSARTDTSKVQESGRATRSSGRVRHVAYVRGPSFVFILPVPCFLIFMSFLCSLPKASTCQQRY